MKSFKKNKLNDDACGYDVGAAVNASCVIYYVWFGL